MQLETGQQRTVVVTGGSQGIGAVICRTFAESDARVIVHYRSNQDAANDVVDSIRQAGGTAEALPANLDDSDEVDQFFALANDLLGPISVLINNAGTFPNAGLLDMTADDWRAMYANNVESTFLCSQAAARRMQNHGGGAIVNVASISGLQPGMEHAHYNSAKAAVIAFTQSAALEFGEHNIRVNAVAPGLVWRPNLAEQWPQGIERYTHRAPLSSLVQPEDVANACEFLASDKAARITGVVLPVDSGVLTAPSY